MVNPPQSSPPDRQPGQTPGTPPQPQPKSLFARMILWTYKVVEKFMDATKTEEVIPFEQLDTPGPANQFLDSGSPSEVVKNEIFGFDEHDSIGFTEPYRIAWHRPTMIKMRRGSGYCWGPLSGLFSPTHSLADFWNFTVFESALTGLVFFLGLGLLNITTFLGPILISLGLSCGALVLRTYPQVCCLEPDEPTQVEPASWEELAADLNNWSKAEAEGSDPCIDCNIVQAHLSSGLGPDRLADILADEISPAFDRMTDNFNWGPSPLTLHPEGPMLARRAALSALAWQLTLLYKKAGAAPARRREPLPPLSDMEEFWAWWEGAIRKTASETAHGHTTLILTIPTFLPSSWRLRRRFSARTYGPMRLFVWTARYRGALVRSWGESAAYYTLALGLIGLGVAALGTPPCSRTAVIVVSLVLTTLGLWGAAVLVGSNETYGSEYVVPNCLVNLLDEEPHLDLEDEEDTETLVYPATPGNLPAWTWEDHLRTSHCPKCTQHGPGSPGFYETYLLLPPQEWNDGLRRYLGVLGDPGSVTPDRTIRSETRLRPTPPEALKEAALGIGAARRSRLPSWYRWAKANALDGPNGPKSHYTRRRRPRAVTRSLSALADKQPRPPKE